MKNIGNKSTKAKILYLDVETRPLLGFLWGTWDQTIGLNMIEKEWSLLSFSALWEGDKPSDIIYHDVSKNKDMEDDTNLLKKLWTLMDQADIIIGHNLKKFDTRKIQARFLLEGFPPPSSFRQIDTLQIARKHFALTSNKLEFLTDKLNKKFKKLKHKEFSGFELWKHCMLKNPKAWSEMKLYNIHDTLALQELYHTLQKWDSSINFDVYTNTNDITCSCGSKEFKRNGFKYSNSGKFQRYKCTTCSRELRDKTNLLSKDKKDSLKRTT